MVGFGNCNCPMAQPTAPFCSRFRMYSELLESTLRYAKNSVVISLGRDIPLLRQSRNSRFISYEQLFTLLHHARFEGSLPSFRSRVRRLRDAGHLHASEGSSWAV